MKLKVLTEPDFDSRLEQARTEAQVNALLAELNAAIRNCQNANKKSELQYIRQSAYNKKKKIIKESINGIHNILHSSNGDPTNSNNDTLQSESKSTSEIDRRYPRLPNSFETSAGNVRATQFEKGLIIAKNIAPVALYSLCALTSLTFVYMQSVPLYASSGFTNPELCSFGALLMIVGFSLIHAINKSKLALLLCLYASAYEVTLIVQGTFKNETTIISTTLLSSGDIQFLQEKSRNRFNNYELSKKKYDDPDSSVYQNSWFKTKQVDADWRKYEETQNELENKKSSFINDAQPTKTSILKILYRLGLVFLCMISIHNLIKVTIKDRK